MSTENLKSKEAIEKLKELVDKIDVGMVITRDEDGKSLHMVPMSRQEVDSDGNIWLMISSESKTHDNLMRNPRVDVAYSHVGDYVFLSVSGKASVSRDHARIEKYWNKMMETWFDVGKDDPSIRIVKIDAEDAHYWDNKSNKVVTFLKMATNVITGSNMDIGREGELNL